MQRTPQPGSAHRLFKGDPNSHGPRKSLPLAEANGSSLLFPLDFAAKTGPLEATVRSETKRLSRLNHLMWRSGKNGRFPFTGIQQKKNTSTLPKKRWRTRQKTKKKLKNP